MEETLLLRQRHVTCKLADTCTIAAAFTTEPLSLSLVSASQQMRAYWMCTISQQGESIQKGSI